jgi:hypothetical protein
MAAENALEDSTMRTPLEIGVAAHMQANQLHHN